jgi:UDP-2-acetamido-2-deoxy-ribo-hexuluronate aminotransferase
MKFNHVGLHAQEHKKKILKRVEKVIDSGVFLQGPEMALLEKRMSDFLGGGTVLVVSSGHDALYLSLLALNLQPDDEVIFPANAYPTAFPVYLLNVKPVLADVDQNGQIDLDQLKKKVTSKTKVIIWVHLYGLVGEIEKAKDFIRERNIVLIEDCAQAFGSQSQNKYVGTTGDIGCFSFYPTKNLGTLGDGGAIWTKKPEIVEYITRCRTYGEAERYKSLFVTGHSRMPEIQAAIVNVYFDSWESDVQKRRQLREHYIKLLGGKNLAGKVRVLESRAGSQPARHLFVIEAERRDELKTYLEKKGIETHIHYPVPIHQVAAFSAKLTSKEPYPVAERLCQSILSLPFHQYFSLTDVNQVVDAISAFYLT